MKKRRPRLTDEEVELIEQFRSRHKALAKECEEKGIPLEEVKHYWHKGKNFSIFTKPNQKSYEDVRDYIVQEMMKYAPKYRKVKHKKVTNPHLLVIDPADIHFGKLATAEESGDPYNVDIAQQRVLDGVLGLVQKAAGFPIEKILFVIGNDVLHIDSPRRTTTSGTPQDTDGMWFQSFVKAKDTIVQVVETLREIAPVHVHYDPSNHDYMSGFYLADTIASWFHRCKDVTFNNTIAHRKYYRYGNSLIGTTHGDGANVKDLPLLMAQEASGDWADTKHRCVYIHHVHHKMQNDHIGVTVESLRSPSGTDSWHHKQGYQHSPKAVEAFVHCKEHGQVARLTHIF